MAPQWSAALAVGVDDIDEQHRELFRRAGELVVALKGGRRTDVGALVEYLGEYADRHFAAEEALMRETAYPGLERHRARHEEFRADLRRYVGEYERKGATPLVTLTLHNWLSDWLRGHVSTADVDVGAHVARFRASRGA
ncbi:MAG: hemerythrin family protein [Anaeromyxobacter sp.]